MKNAKNICVMSEKSCHKSIPGLTNMLKNTKKVIPPV